MIYPKRFKEICSHPGCNTRTGLEAHHVIFKSETKKKIINDWCVWLCSDHHRGSFESPHMNREWREYYKKFLPKDWKEQIGNCQELR